MSGTGSDNEWDEDADLQLALAMSLSQSEEPPVPVQPPTEADQSALVTALGKRVGSPIFLPLSLLTLFDSGSIGTTQKKTGGL